MTTEKVLNPLYELEAKSERRVMNGLNLKTAPQGSCVNRSPNVQVINPNADSSTGADTPAVTSFAARIGTELSLNGEVLDDALPRDSKLVINWKKNSGPGNVTFSSTDTGPTRASFSVPGEYELELSGTDGEKANSVKIKVTVAPATPTGGGGQGAVAPRREREAILRS